MTTTTRASRRARPQAHGLKFTPGNHRYTLDGKWVPGVTTILGVLDKPALVKWAAGLVAEFVADRPDEVEMLRNVGRTTLVTTLRNLPDESKKKAGGRGTDLHEIMDQIVRGLEVDVPDEHVAVIEHAMDFLDDWSIDPLLVETPVASREHKYAGTVDLIARYAHPVTGHTGVAIFDWKSSKAMYPEYAMQLNAYAHAEFASPEPGDEQPIPECDAAFGVHIRPDGYDVLPFKFGPEIHAEFVRIRHVYDVVKRMRGNWKMPGSGYVGVAVVKGETA